MTRAWLALAVLSAVAARPEVADAATPARRYLVTFAETTVPDQAGNAPQLASAARTLDAAPHVEAYPLAGRLAEVRSTLSAGALRKLPGVAAVEEDRPLQLAAVDWGDEPGDGAQWPLFNGGGKDLSGVAGTAGADIGAPEAWTLSTGAGVIVAVGDTGVEFDHPDLEANLWQNTDEVCGSADDNDANGFAGDCRGWDFGARDSDPSPTAPGTPAAQHGTHVAGVVGSPRNGRGLSGVAPDAKLMVLKVSDDRGTVWLSAAAASILYAADNGARVYNASWGWLTSTSPSMTAAIDHAADKGMLVVAAAGNDGRTLGSATRYFPASYAETRENVVSVAASSSTDVMATFSNRGAVSIAAPGLAVPGPVPGGGRALASGTSEAAPHVAGAAALLFALNPGWTPGQVKARLMSTAARPTSLGGAGAGRLDLARAVGAGPTGRGTPVAPLVSAALIPWSRSIAVTWLLPSPDGVDHVEVSAVDAQGVRVASTTVAPGVSTTTLTGLAPASPYEVQVRVVAADATFASALAAATTPLPVPPAANVRLNGTATAVRLEFDRASGAVRYLVSVTGATREFAVSRTSPTTLSASFGPYTAGTLVTATVTAVGPTGEHSASVDVAFTTADASPPPTGTVTAGFGSLTVAVDAVVAAADRPPVTAYVVRAGVRWTTVPVGLDGRATAAFKAVVGAQEVSVQAMHGIADPLPGASATLGTFTPIPTIRPQPPTGVAVTQPVGKIRVTWDAGGPTTTWYEVKLGKSPPVRVPAGQLSYEFVNPGKAGGYTVTVWAANQFGKSQTSATVLVEPAQPSPVDNLEVNVGPTVEVTWDVPPASWSTYFVLRVNGGRAQTVRGAHFVMPAPAAGSYTVSVVAMNPYGSSAPTQAAFTVT